LHERLEDGRKQALDGLRSDETVMAAVIGDIEEARTRTAAWTFEVQGFEALEPGLRRIYGRGREAMRRARADPTDENLHQWRKRVKDLWHAEQIMRFASPKKMKKLAKRTHALSDVLGDDHDLAELRLSIERHGDRFDDHMAQDAQLAVIERRRTQLQRRAFGSGQKLHRRKPKRFVKGIERGWRNRPRLAQPGTGAGGCG
jgi:CHAD domain-containing protein